MKKYNEIFLKKYNVTFCRHIWFYYEIFHWSWWSNLCSKRM